MPSSDFAIVIPAYNEQATIRDIAQRALEHYDIVIVVDDGSSDDTVAQIQDLPLTLIKHEQNLGKAASLWDGINAARQHKVKGIITLDGDGQHAPEDIPLLVAKFQNNPGQIIIGARLADKAAIPAKRYYANRIANFWIAWAAGYPIQDSQSGFRLYPSELFEELRISISKHSSFVFESEILIKAAHRGIYSQPVAIPAVYAENARPSHFRGVRDITFITLMVARILLQHLLYPQGLYRSAIRPHLPRLPSGEPDTDGMAMLLLSSLLVPLTGGISLLLSFLYILQQAVSASTHCPAGALLLLFGKKLKNNLPDDEYLSRLQRANKLLAEQPDSRVLILGGQTGSASISESQAGKDYLLQQGIAPDRIGIEERSHNTLENIKEAISLFDPRQAVTLVSNRYHLARISTLARGFKLQVRPCAAEAKLEYRPSLIVKLVIEAIYLHWYFTGKYWARLTNNQRMLDRIS